MFRRFVAWVGRYERHLSAAAMFFGFVSDAFFFERVDLPGTQLLFAAYAFVCLVSITVLHRIESRALSGQPRSWLRPFLPIVTQFALGGFLSGVLVVYGRGASVGVSWPFLLFVAVMLIGNEVLRKYHDRLIFTNTLFFFALYAYAIFTVPVYTGGIGVGTFLISSACALGFLFLFTGLLRFVGRERFQQDVRHMRLGAISVLLVVNLFYFTNVLPPLPLTLQSGGIYHAVQRSGDAYIATDEAQSWRVALGAPAILHVRDGEPLYAYSAIFAPVKLNTTIIHRWQRYDEAAEAWKVQSVVSFPIIGGRDGGYRAYSIKSNPSEGRWRVSVETAGGKVLGRIDATVLRATTSPAYLERTLE